MNSSKLYEDMAALDELLLKGDAWPITRPIMTMALVLDRSPTCDRLDAVFGKASALVPRMRQRVSKPAWAGLPATWVEDESFDIAHHLTRVGAPGDGSLDAAITWASTSATRPFDPARPLWDAVLVENLDDHRALLVIRAHHAIADGVRSIQMMAALLTLDSSPAPVEEVLAEERERAALFPRQSRLVLTSSRAIATNTATAVNITLATSKFGLRPVTTLAHASRYVRSALRTIGRGEAESSALLSGRGSSRRFVTLEMSLESLKAAARSHGATVNDVYLTALLGGFRKYHEAQGYPVTDVPLALPIDVSGGSRHAAGNHISAAIIPGPSSIEDPVARLHRVHDLVVSRRAEPGLGALERLAPMLRQVPSSVAATAIAAHARRVDLQASNLVGPPCPVYIAGEKVDRMFAFGPLPGVPAMAVLVSYDGICTVGLTLDPEAVTDTALFTTCMRDAFAELCP